jgi:putative cell wall-binding protein
MRLIYLIVVLFLLISAGAAQLSPDKERFDVVLHPGELEDRTLKLTNTGDASISKITSTQVSGSAKDLIFLVMPEEKLLQPKDEAEIEIFFAISPETKPGIYTGYIYLLESTPPTMPIRIEFNLNIVGQESYGLGMTIDDAKSNVIHAKAEEIAEFNLAIKNLGVFRDVASINTSAMPEGWTVTLSDGEKELSIPYDVPLAPGATHSMKLLIETSEPGKKGDLKITATSLGNRSINTSVDASVEFGMAVRGYNVDIEIPDLVVANKTYKGSFNIGLDVTENVLVGIVTPPELMVIPLAQVVEVTPNKPGIANFTMLASLPGDYPIIFRLMDSNGIPMPEEATSVKVVLPKGVAVLTGEDFLHSTVASLSSPENGASVVVNVPSGKLSEKTRESLQDYSRIVILGNQSTVSMDAERALEDIEVKRIQGENLCIECWLFAAEMWQNGSSSVVLSSSQPIDIFRGYQLAKTQGLPLVICDGNVNQAVKSAIIEMTKRNVTLSKALTVGEIGDENTKVLQDAGISMEEVT